ncbi:hypothetical protein C7S16_5271 [Burkholderia thailandensis]|uniref:DUF1534 domain-containing protein n=1 Tax=Burkholderia thailandensis TaxID=57975 RepID=A0AAW9CSP5_BURTH|nr:hypothetical protein [Burkholderia thailandensis]MDW9252846.1 hypothetical protein [Burkholderia thailandensis]
MNARSARPSLRIGGAQTACGPNRPGRHAAARFLFRAQRSRLTLGSGA